MIGDIVLQDGNAWAFVMEKMSRYLAENLMMIRHTSVVTEITADFSELPEPEMEEISGTVSSVRLDSVIALCGRLSASYIEDEKVSVNGAVCTNVSLNLRGGEILSIRGIGKFRFGEPGNLTKKGRTSVVVYRYK
jgi:RNA-binding protein YlmH